MTKQRTAAEAEKVIAEATEQVIQEGGIVHEDSLWDVHEMALDGEPKESMVQRLKQARAKAYKPKGAWFVPRG